MHGRDVNGIVEIGSNQLAGSGDRMQVIPNGDALYVGTWFNAGLRVYDLADPTSPEEIAHWIPDCPPGQKAVQINDVYVADDLTIYATDRVTGGVYALEPEPWLAEKLDNGRRSP